MRLWTGETINLVNIECMQMDENKRTLSAQTFKALTDDFFPVYKAVAELAESVMNESIEWVIWLNTPKKRMRRL